jgi:hypothetical protein
MRDRAFEFGGTIDREVRCGEVGGCGEGSVASMARQLLAYPA